MKLPRDLKGSDLAKALCRDWGYRIVHQEGSHLILQTEIPSFFDRLRLAECRLRLFNV